MTSDKMVINILVSTIIGLTLITIAVGLVGDNPLVVGALVVAILVNLGSILFAVRGATLPGRVLLPLLLTIIIGIIAFNRGALYHISISGFPVVIVLAGLLLNSRGAFIIAALSSLVAGIVGYADINGLSPYASTSRTGYDDIIVAATLFFTTATVLRIIIIRLTESIRDAEIFGQAQEHSNIQLRTLQSELEQRITERTAELEKRANQLDAISDVARSTASLQDLDDLLPAITRLVSARFDYYHTGIFLIDDEQEFAVLRAANSDGGKKMLNRQHKLKLDAHSIVGFVTSRGEPRIALDVGSDAVFFDNPDLPNTRSEMALPLRVGGNVIGALDVQSTQPNAFTEADVNILSTLADQVAIAIENSRLFSEAREALKRSEETFTQYIRQEWVRFARQAKTTGYRFDGSRTIPLDSKDIREQTKENQDLSIPIKFRGQVIGVLDVRPKNSNRKWTQDDITLLEAAAERTALALENTRLVEASQRRASRERTIGEISSKIGAVSDVEAIMQTAVEELGRKIGGAAEVSLELDSKQVKF
ncbi:MAG: GAF domain-containing protein [Anaerolineales bacterium]|nr:GAF domain-containing protein [Anaerolineales bacterium]